MKRIASLPQNVLVRRLIAAVLNAIGAWLVALLIGIVPLLKDAVHLADNVFYDAFYHLRPAEDRTAGDVVIVAVDQKSLDAIDKTYHYGWPWPREFWGLISQYLGQCGAKAVAFDIVFTETSVYQNQTGDDDSFAGEVDSAKAPVVFGALVNSDGTWGHLAPPVKKPVFGAVNVGDDKIYRRYDPSVSGKPSMAASALTAAGMAPRLSTQDPFLLHYYGPYKTRDGKHTFRYISAANVLAAAAPDAKPQAKAAAPADLFKGKIVLIGAITVGTYDLKSSPLSDEYPGVEVQATAIENLIGGQKVTPVGPLGQQSAALIAALMTALIVVFPRKAILKALGPVLAIAAILAIAAMLFKQPAIHWLSPTGPLLAIGIATIGAFSWTYLAEDRQRRFMLKALSKVVSPAVAEQLAREPQRLALGTVRTQITLLFTDLANFTDMSEAMDVQKLGELLNRYLGEMSDQVLQNQGTLDKYIGDAIMCFWNAPLPQKDHATRACRAALAIAARESEIRAELQSLGAAKIFTRIGVNTTDAAVGFVGSAHLFNYTALGDGVNLASRLEGANKLYGTRILLSQTTADLVKHQFILRKLDVLRVKGKKLPMAVYELLGERGDNGHLESFKPLIERYESAFANYQNQKWDDAEQDLLELLTGFSDDAASKALLKRISTLRGNPPSDDWDGVYEAKEK